MKIHQMPSTHSVVMVTLLLFLIKNSNIPVKWLDEQWQTNREVLSEVLWQWLQPLTGKQKPCAENGYYNVLCADGNFMCCNLDLARCLTDCPEYSDLHHVKWHGYFWCKCPNNELGGDVPSDKQYHQRDHNLYRMLSDANTKTADAKLS